MIEDKKYKRKKNVIQKGIVPMLSIKMVSEKYGFHPQTVRNWVNRDGLKSVKHGTGNKVFIRQDDVEAFIDTWYGDEPRMLWMAHHCVWLGCEEISEIDLTIHAKPDHLPEGWEHLVLSKGWQDDKVMASRDFGGWLCPKHHAELLSLLKKDEGEEPDTDTAPEKGENE